MVDGKEKLGNDRQSVLVTLFVSLRGYESSMGKDASKQMLRPCCSLMVVVRVDAMVSNPLVRKNHPGHRKLQ